VGSIKKDDNLSKRIETAIGKKENKTTNYDNLNVSLVNTFSRVATELLAGLIIGVSVGWAIDNWLETSPLFLIILFLLGGAAGILNLWRLITGKGLKIGYFN
jgi:ATP synthase protein I